MLDENVSHYFVNGSSITYLSGGAASGVSGFATDRTWIDEDDEDILWRTDRTWVDENTLWRTEANAAGADVPFAADSNRSSFAFRVPMSDVRDCVHFQYQSADMSYFIEDITTGRAHIVPAEELSISGNNLTFYQHDIARLLLPKDHDIFHMIPYEQEECSRCIYEATPIAHSDDGQTDEDPSLVSALNAILDQ